MWRVVFAGFGATSVMLVAILLLVSLGLALFRYGWWYALKRTTMFLGYGGLLLAASAAFFGDTCGMPSEAMAAVAAAAVLAFGTAVWHGHIVPASPLLLASAWAGVIVYVEPGVCTLFFTLPAAIVITVVLFVTKINVKDDDTEYTRPQPFLTAIWRAYYRRR